MLWYGSNPENDLVKWRPRLYSRIDKAANMDVDAAQHIAAMSAATIHRQTCEPKKTDFVG
jgi:predicted TIM-barrel enzyme